MAPPTYVCGGCERARVEARFSSTAIRKYQNAIQQAQKKAEARVHKANAKKTHGRKNIGKESKIIIDLSQILRPRCMECNGGSTHELKCSYCDVVKDLDSFSRQMRRDPDNALCWNCSQDKQDLEPDHRDQVQEEIAMERIRIGATVTSLGRGSTAIGYSANSRTMGHSNGFSAGTNVDGSSDWINAPIPIPEDPRAGGDSSCTHTRSPSNVSNSTYVSNTSAVTGTGWENFQTAAYRGGSRSAVSSGGANAGFAKQGAVKQDPEVKAQLSLARLQLKEAEQAEQAAQRDSDDDDSDDDDDDPY